MLVVEDPFIFQYLNRLLAPRGYRLIRAGAPDAAALLRAGDCGVSLLISNVPEEFLEFAERTPLVYLSSTPNPSLAARFRACRTVCKPFRAETLLSAMEELTAGRYGVVCGTGASACRVPRAAIC